MRGIETGKVRIRHEVFTEIAQNHVGRFIKKHMNNKL